MYTDVAAYDASYSSPYNAAHDCVTTNIVYATSLRIIPHINQKKVPAYKLVENRR